MQKVESVIEHVGVVWGFSEAERHAAQARIAKDRLNAATERLIAGDRAAAAEAAEVQQELALLRGSETSPAPADVERC